MNKSIGFLALLSLTACSTYQENFDCPVGEGIRCASLSTINKKMDKGHIQLEKENAAEEKSYFGSEFSAGIKG